MGYICEYERTVLFKNDDIEVVEIKWQPGQKSPIHKHGACSGMVSVLEGSIHEEVFTDENGVLTPSQTHEYHAGERFTEDALGVHRISNITGECARTLHVYMPPAQNEILDEAR